MTINKAIPVKNIIQGGIVTVSYPGQQECYKCKNPSEKCDGRGIAKKCSAKESVSWKTRLKERLSELHYNLSDMEVGGEVEEGEDEDQEALGQSTEEEEEAIELITGELLEEFNIVGMRRMEKDVLWEMVKRRMPIEEGDTNLVTILESKEEEYNEAEVTFKPFKEITEYGTMTIKSKDSDLLRGLWMGVVMMKDSIELKLEPKYRNKKTTPQKNKVNKKELTPLEKFKEEIRELEKKLRKAEKEKKEEEQSRLDENEKAANKKTADEDALKTAADKEAANRLTSKKSAEKEKNAAENKPAADKTAKNAAAGKETVEKTAAEKATIEAEHTPIIESTPKKKPEDHEVVIMEEDNKETEEEPILVQEKSEESMRPPCPPDPARLGRTTSKEGGTLKCGKCKACKFKCEECTSCLTEPKKPGGPQKGCEKREICLTPKRRSPSKTPNRSVSKKREGGDLEDPNAKVKKKIDDLEKKGNKTAMTESNMVATG